MSDNLFATFRSHFPEDLSRPFLIENDGTTISYGEMLAASGRIANVLHALGVRPGDRVAVQVDKSPQAVMLYLATLRTGAVYLPLNPGYVPDEVRYFLADARPTILVCRSQDAENRRAIAGELGIVHVETLDAAGVGTLLARASSQSSDYSDAPRAPDDLAAILYTSGTTGRPKGAMITHGNLVSNAETLCRYWAVTDEDRLLHTLPMYHTHGLFVAINVMLIAGGVVILLPRFDVERVIRLLPQSTLMMGVPTFYTRLLAHHNFSRKSVSSVRLFISGSAPLSADTHREFMNRTGHAILERYGMTETNMISSNPLKGERIAGSVGLPLPGIEVRITDLQSGSPSPAEVGMIEVRGPNVCRGYWKQPEKTGESIRSDGYFVTGDLGYFDAQGYLHISGREKDLIISGGLNIYPAEIENAITALPEIADCAVIGVPHHDFGEGVVAVVTAKPGMQIASADVISSVAARLAKHKRPKKVIITDEIPRNSMGKVEKKTLRDMYLNALHEYQ